MNHVMINFNLISTLIFICSLTFLSMSTNRRSNRNNRNARRQGESDILNRLAEILERHSASPLPAPKPQYSIKQFMICKPPKYTGEEGATALLQWFEALENTFVVSECPDYLQVRYATTVLTKRALTWFNGQKIVFGLDGLTNLAWSEFKDLLLEEFCPANEIVKLEEEFSKLEQHGGDNNTYTTRFHELSLLVPHSVTPEPRAILKYIKGLPMKVQNHVTVAQPDTLSAAIRIAATISDNYVTAGKLTLGNKTKTPIEPRTEEPNHKKSKTNQNYAITSPTPPTNSKFTYTTQQTSRQPPTQTNTPQRREYIGPHPLCVNCTFHHPINASCRLCTSCDRLGHFATNCRTNPIPINSVAPTPCIPNIKPAKSCYECGDPTHFKKTCPNLRITPASQPEHNRNFALITSQDQVHPLNQLATPTIPTPQHDQAPDFYDSVMNS